MNTELQNIIEHKSLQNIELIVIEARTWFQKTYGNTYHRVLVHIHYADGNIITLDSGCHYGYGRMYLQTALNIFKKHFGLNLPKYSNGSDVYCYLTSLTKDLNIKTIEHCVEVARQKDMMNF